VNRKRSGLPVASLTEAAFFSALTALLCIVGSYIPFLGIIADIAVPVPIIILTMRVGLELGILSTLVAAALVGILVEPYQAIMVILGSGFIGIALGGALREKLSPGKVLFMGSIASLTSKILIILILAWFVKAPILGTPETMGELLSSVEEMVRSRGFPEEDVEELLTGIKGMISFISLIFPAILAMASVFDTYINFTLTRFVSKRLGQEIPGLPPFTEWRVPWQLTWVYVLSVLTVSAGQSFGIGFLYALGMNIYYITVYAFMIAGLAVVAYFLKAWQLPRFFNWLLIFLIFLIPKGVLLVHFLGLFDVWFNFRERFKTKKAIRGDTNESDIIRKRK
jgi:uncharacterized protein YybS (DUF2232 family)